MIYRRLTTCAPLNLKDIKKVELLVDESGTMEEVENIYAGPSKLGYGALNHSTPTFSRNLRAPAVGRGYTLESVVPIEPQK